MRKAFSYRIRVTGNVKVPSGFYKVFWDLKTEYGKTASSNDSFCVGKVGKDQW